MTLIATDRYRVVVGMGQTGLSAVRYLVAKGESPVVMDTREQPPLLETFRKEFPQLSLVTGVLDAAVLAAADELIVSPGVALETPAIAQALAKGVTLGSDVDLFCEACDAPVLAITGSNGKSTVTAWVGDMAQRAGKRAGVGGNLGTPALDLLKDAPLDVAVLELSSFQLERVHALAADVATILNITPDHQDRYADMAAYHRAKHRIYKGARHVVYSREDALTQPLMAVGQSASSFGLSEPDLGHWGIRQQDGETWLCRGIDNWLPVSAMRLQGRHNWLNALAALAIGEAAGFARQAMLDSLQGFAGLPHRCVPVATINGVHFVNDSKGTNVGASIAAIEGVAVTPAVRVVLIAGGEPKDQSFADLAPVMARHGRSAILIGKAAGELASVLAPVVPVTHAGSMPDAVAKAQQVAHAGDVVLLSPACASFDMFRDYADRGEHFVAAVKALGGAHAS
ncbi:MAG: UDP-N-acetylmuramoyl-L-alanine--D-glutamate ligase [Gammaproteobacteria bacterium]|nr:MAG: UDP-N-acetylmuramoyl-L-alanine--D-glutamate ligase [Gammaproteobacteria bacterium]